MYGTSFSRRTRQRRGTTAVETAFVLPVFLMFVLAIIEFGHAQLVNNMLRSACRAGARLGSTEGSSSADVEAHVRDVIGSAVNPDSVQIFVKDASVYDEGGEPPESGESLENLPSIELTDAEPRQLFMVRAKIPYNQVALVPVSIPFLGHFMDQVVLEGQAFMRHE